MHLKTTFGNFINNKINLSFLASQEDLIKISSALIIFVTSLGWDGLVNVVGVKLTLCIKL